MEYYYPLISPTNLGGCDGCVNIENDSNNGLANLIEDLEDIYKNNGFEDVLSRFCCRYIKNDEFFLMLF